MAEARQHVERDLTSERLQRPSCVGDDWEFTGPTGVVHVRVVPRMRTKSCDTCRAVAVAHQASRGTLVHGGRRLGPKVRALIDHLARAFGDTP